MDKIKRGMILLLLLIVIVISIMFIITGKKKEDNESQASLEQSFEEVNQLKKIENEAEWLTIQTCLNTYQHYSKDLGSVKENQDEETMTLEEHEYYDQLKERLLNLIPEFVKEELAITKENVYETVGIKNAVIRISHIYESTQTINTIPYEETTHICAYVVEGVLIDKHKGDKTDFHLVIIMDKINNTFAIIPDAYIQSKNITLWENSNLVLYEEEQIRRNDSNQYIDRKASPEEICKRYFADYQTNLMYDTQYVYDSLEKEYREKRFGSFDDFEKYVQRNLEEMKACYLSKYLVNTYEGYTEYVCKDQYENLYIFKATKPLQFTMTLDTYTLPNEKFTNTYHDSEDQMKVMMNVDKWIQMINNRDYRTAYQFLEENFRKDRFGTVEKFEEYMRTYLPDHYRIDFGTFSDQGQIYIQDISLSDMTGKDLETKQKSIIMKLEEDTHFVMSFDV